MDSKKKFSRRDFLKGVGLASAGTFLAACTPKVEKVVETVVQEVVVTATPEVKQVELEYMVPGLDSNAGWKDKMTPLIDQFNEENPGIKVKFGTCPWTQDREVILTRLVSGQAPDVILTHSNRVNEIGQSMQGFVVFDEFEDFAEVATWFPEVQVDSVKSVDGNHYGLPLQTLIFATAVNVAMFHDAGVEVPLTWSELRSACKAVTIPGKQWGLGWPMGASIDTAYRVYPYAMKAGSRFLNEDLTEAIWNDEASLATMQTLLDIQADGSFVPGTDVWTGAEEWSAWSQKVFAVAIGGPWIPLVTPPEMLPDIKLIPTPLPDQGAFGAFPEATLSDNIMITIATQTKYRNEAWKFVKFMRTPESDKIWLDPTMAGIPVNKKSYEDPKWKEYWGYEVYQQEAEKAIPWPYSSILGELHNEYTLAISQVWSGQKSLKEAFDEGVARCNKLIAGG